MAVFGGRFLVWKFVWRFLVGGFWWAVLGGRFLVWNFVWRFLVAVFGGRQSYVGDSISVSVAYTKLSPIKDCRLYKIVAHQKPP